LDSSGLPKGSLRIAGKLANDGFYYVNIYLLAGIFTASGKISEDGKQIVLDDGKIARFTLTRK
jgi:hypothetical protein